jgi:protein-tyrosine sulfotransferase
MFIKNIPHFKTVVLPQILTINKRIQTTEKAIRLTSEAGLSAEKIRNAIRLYVYSIMSEHVRDAERLCAKDPTILKHLEYLNTLFPNAKFVYLVRDPRAQVVSYMKYLNQTLTSKNKLKYLSEWNDFNNDTYNQCLKVGKDRCIVVNYESLVQNTKKNMREVAKFLDISWTDDFLHHEEFIGSKIVASKVEWSTDQIKHPVYKDALNNWKGVTKFDLVDLNEKAPMYKKFGYNVKLEHHDYLKE